VCYSIVEAVENDEENICWSANGLVKVCPNLHNGIRPNNILGFISTKIATLKMG